MDFILKPKENIHQLYFKGTQIPEVDMKLTAIDSATVYGIEALPRFRLFGGNSRGISG